MHVEHESLREARTDRSTGARGVGGHAATRRRVGERARHPINMTARTKPDALADSEKRNTTSHVFDQFSLPLPTSLITSHAFNVVATREKIA